MEHVGLEIHETGEKRKAEFCKYACINKQSVLVRTQNGVQILDYRQLKNGDGDNGNMRTVRFNSVILQTILF